LTSSDAVDELLGLHPSSWTLVEHTTQTIRRLAIRGNVILVGRGSDFILAHFSDVYHVRLVRQFEAPTDGWCLTICEERLPAKDFIYNLHD
jgi:hypothetical protein